MRRDSLDDVLHRIGFGSKLRVCQGHLNSSRGSVLDDTLKTLIAHKVDNFMVSIHTNLLNQGEKMDRT